MCGGFKIIAKLMPKVVYIVGCWRSVGQLMGGWGVRFLSLNLFSWASPGLYVFFFVGGKGLGGGGGALKIVLTQMPNVAMVASWELTCSSLSIFLVALDFFELIKKTDSGVTKYTFSSPSSLPTLCSDRREKRPFEPEKLGFNSQSVRLRINKNIQNSLISYGNNFIEEETA